LNKGSKNTPLKETERGDENSGNVKNALLQFLYYRLTVEIGS
jgi:hypothetical protein